MVVIVGVQIVRGRDGLKGLRAAVGDRVLESVVVDWRWSTGGDAPCATLCGVSTAGLSTSAHDHAAIRSIISRIWGFDALRPLQREAIEAGVSGRDSLVVMPTGGGKSLCYQVPPLVAERTDLVVSPLISLMKDQVDGLRANGYPAAAIHSHLDPIEKREIFNALKANELRLLFVSPERLANNDFQNFIRQLNITNVAIDEAHCISHWGHDFRPEYRRLAELKQWFPGATVHAFTATATPRVQQDIVDLLHLDDPQVLVGRFDRPNLSYRVIQRVDVYSQVIEVVRRHPGEGVIVYCISRRDTETLAHVLNANGINAAAYHAGLERDQRRDTQEAFAAEQLDVVVATVAFGMGIDRSNVRCVLHAAMPKSVEHYQQETGRAGRDGLEAECVLLYSAADHTKWIQLLERSAAESESETAGEHLDAQRELLRHMQKYCGELKCRHRALSEYFGQEYPHDNCGACDVCLDEVDALEDSTTIAQKILSCVARFEINYGVGYLVEVLRGAKTDNVWQRGHDQLSTYGLLREFSDKVLTNLVYQLVDLNVLDRTTDDRPTLALNEQALAVLRGERSVKLLDPRTTKTRDSKADVDEWEGVDRDLFEHLRTLRRDLAEQRGAPASVILGDRTLRDLARIRPASFDMMRRARGIGEKKLNEFGQRLVDEITAYCAEHDLTTDVDGEAPAPQIVIPKQTQPNPSRDQAIAMFARDASIEEVASAVGRATSTVANYLQEFIEREKPESVATWVDDDTYRRVTEAVDRVGMDRLRPVYDALNEAVPYETIKVVTAHLRMRSEAL